MAIGSGLTRVAIAEGLHSLGEEAFCGCSSLTEAVLPSSLEEIGLHAFHQTIPMSIAYRPLQELVCTVQPGSLAEKYCLREGIPCRRPE